MISLKAIFLIPILAVGAVAAVHAAAYIYGEARRRATYFWVFFAATLASMAAVVLAEGKLPFLLAWEAMGLSSVGLVAFEARHKNVRKATWIYLLACHAGACLLMLAFVMMSRPDAIMPAMFCAVAGFGLKIGFPLLHVWLPQAHPAAPAPASAVMSGAMIPLGFYGLFSFFPIAGFDGSVLPVFAWTLLALGATGSVGGILFALPQSNLKRLLAFSSVENMGVVAIGFGLGALASGIPGCGPAAALCTAGAFAHILNHAFLKGSLFLAAGSVLRQTGTLDQDRLGGLMRRMPVTGTLFTVNAFGLAGLPPLNGFLGELAIYIGAFTLVKSGVASAVAAGFLAIVVLAATGGFAAAAYAKAIGGAFLGLPRTEASAQAVETPKRMWGSIAALTLLSVAMVPGTIWFVHVNTDGFATPALVVSAVAGFCLAALSLALVVLRRFVCPRGGEKTVSPGWDCGYEAPTPRMAYTATAFTQPLADLFKPLLRSRRHVVPFSGPPASPSDAAIATETDDLALSGFWRPVFTSAARLFQRLHLLQNGSLHLYILISLLAMLALLVSALVS